MLVNPVQLSFAVREAAARHRMAIPRTARCETFYAGEPEQDAEGLRCMSCTHPLLRENERLALGIIAGGTPADRGHLRDHLVDLLRATGLALPDAQLFTHPEVLMLVVPWPYRGELRAVLVKAAETWRVAHVGALEELERFSDSAAAESSPGESSFVSSLPGDGTGSVDHAEFRRLLLDFGLAYDGAVRAAVRLLLSGDAHRKWEFPLGCTVLEARSRRGVTWTIEFLDLETLERAYVLLNPVLREMERKGSRLRPGDAHAQDLGDEVETRIPALCITTLGNTQQARVEMARLIKSLILTLDRLGICEEPEGAT